MSKLASRGPSELAHLVMEKKFSENIFHYFSLNLGAGGRLPFTYGTYRDDLIMTRARHVQQLTKLIFTCQYQRNGYIRMIQLTKCDFSGGQSISRYLKYLVGSMIAFE